MPYTMFTLRVLLGFTLYMPNTHLSVLNCITYGQGCDCDKKRITFWQANYMLPSTSSFSSFFKGVSGHHAKRVLLITLALMLITKLLGSFETKYIQLFSENSPRVSTYSFNCSIMLDIRYFDYLATHCVF